MIVVTIALIHLVWDIDCRKLVISLPAPMVRAEKVELSGMYGVACMECVYYLIVCI